MGGIVFQAERVGAFFYVAPSDEGAAKDTLTRSGLRPYAAARAQAGPASGPSDR